MLYRSALALAAATLLFAAGPGQAAFVFNFSPQGGNGGPFGVLKVTCLSGGLCQGHIGNTDRTPFLQEIVTVGGVDYYHLIVLDNPNGFRQEVYIEQSGRNWQGGQGSASGGGPNRNNAFRSGSGSGTANPRKAVLLQTLQAGGMSQTFRKDQLDRKPIITQDVTDAEITASWQLDMGNSSYADAGTAGLLTQTVGLSVPGLGDAGDFDHARDAQSSSVTGGRFTAVGISYSYFDGTFDALQDYCPFRDPAQNVGHGASTC